MKTSELIKKLQEIGKTLPFDATVVSGDEWQWEPLVNVFHEAPRTHLEFKQGQSEERMCLTDQEHSLMDSFMSSVLERYKTNELTLEQATKQLSKLTDMIMFSERSSSVVDYIKSGLN